MINKLYFCECCRNPIEDIEEIHYIEENSDRGFCSEKCIMDFYRPYMHTFEIEEAKLREQLDLETEPTHIDISGNDHYLQLALNNPHEVWLSVDDLGQRFFTHIIEINQNSQILYFILICSYVDGGPAFVYYRTVTKFKSLVDLYRREAIYDNSLEDQDEQAADQFQNFQIPSEIIESMERKKSHILSELMLNSKNSDISIEDYAKYDKYLEMTLENPDEIYANEDEEGDELHTFIKSYKLGEQTFFYIVIVYPLDSAELENTAYLPILGFPSVDEEIYPIYAKGRKLNEPLPN